MRHCRQEKGRGSLRAVWDPFFHFSWDCCRFDFGMNLCLGVPHCYLFLLCCHGFCKVYVIGLIVICLYLNTEIAISTKNKRVNLDRDMAYHLNVWAWMGLTKCKDYNTYSLRIIFYGRMKNFRDTYLSSLEPLIIGKQFQCLAVTLCVNRPCYIYLLG